MNQPCLDCGTPAAQTRCEPCQITHNKRRAPYAKTKNKLYDAAYRREARQVRQTARICWICGQGRKQDDPWQADHIIPLSEGGVRSPLAAAHRSCNITRSNRLMASKRVSRSGAGTPSPDHRPAHRPTQTPPPGGQTPHPPQRSAGTAA